MEESSKGSKSGLGGLLIGAVISLGLLVFLARNIEWSQFIEAFDKINWLYLPVLIVLFYLSLWIRALRWRYLLPSGTELSTARLFDAVVVGLFGTCVLPFRAGEVLRPWVLSKTEPVSFTAGFASVITERVFDVLTILALLGISLSSLDGQHELITLGARALGILAGGILFVMLLAYFWTEKLLAVISRIIQALFSGKRRELGEKLESAAKEFIDGLRAISSLKELLLVIALSFILWLEMALLYQAGLWMFGEFPSLWVGVTLTVFIALAVAAPSAPGFLGTFQAGVVAAMHGVYDYPEAFALAYSVVLHAYQVLLAVITGAWILKRLGLRFSDIKARAAAE